MKRFLIFVLLLIPAIGFAETITLKSGRVIEGKILEQTEDYIKIDFKDVPLTFYFDEIQNVGDDAFKPEGDFSKNIDLEEEVKDPLLEDGGMLHRNEDHEDIFIERMLQAFQKTNDMKQAEAHINALTQFSFEYPDSRFADDAQFLPIFVGFIGSAISKDKKGAEIFLDFMVRVVNKFGTQRLEERTCSELQRLSLKMSFVYEPYSNILIYMKGFLDYELEDYQGSVDNFLELKNNSDFKKDKSGNFVSEVYVTLAISYVRLGREHELKKLYNEVVEKFPDKNNLIGNIKKLVDDFQMFQK